MMCVEAIVICTFNVKEKRKDKMRLNISGMAAWQAERKKAKTG